MKSYYFDTLGYVPNFTDRQIEQEKRTNALIRWQCMNRSKMNEGFRHGRGKRRIHCMEDRDIVLWLKMDIKYFSDSQ